MNTKLFSKIVVPVDGSENSRHAAKYAIDIGSRYNSQVILMNIIYSPLNTEYSNLSGFVTPSQIERLAEKAKDEAEKEFEKIIKDNKENIDFDKADVKTEVVSTSISVYSTILEYVKKEDVDLIVMGSRGRTGLKKILLGSTSSGVVTYAECPVMIIK
ncbi:MAG: hypothetical protein DA328_08405 [Nitrososphaeraceae archaeon]|nr:hypothetical protein [Nitrososphaeraceae archaeon]